ncbi:MAG: ATP-binding protein, partial [bacterium]|nr:ATP-binding protein [bacterium]
QHSKKAITSATGNLRKSISTQADMGSTSLVSQKTIITQSDEFSHISRREKVIKLKQAVTLTQEYTNEIISELNAINEEVTITRDYADAIIRTVRGPLLVLNKDLRIISANEAFYNAFKVAPNDTENRLLYDLGNRQWNIPKLRILLEEILPEKNTIEDFVVEHDFKDIGQKTMLLNARTLRQGPDKTSLILLAIEDITEKKRSLMYTRSLIEASLDPLVTISPDGKITDVNDATIKVTGIPKENLIDTDFSNYFTEPEKASEGYQQVFKKGFVTDYPLTIRHADGKRLTDVLYNASVYKDDKDNVLGIFAAARDITERKQFEQQKDEFIAIASHELKTPVTSIKGYTQVLQSRFQKEGNTKAVELLARMDGQINKLTSLIADLLDATKIEGGKLQFHEGLFDFNELVTNIIGEMQQTTTKHTLIKKLATAKTVYGDRDRIGQVITNLISNAIKYSPHTKKIVITALGDKDSITLSVQDFGVGIPKEKQAMVFDRFFRVSGLREDTFAGLGLGLYIAGEIVKRHSGRIWVESDGKKGTTSCFSLPIKKGRRRNQTNTLVEEEIKHE